jgi:hypothetical protein
MSSTTGALGGTWRADVTPWGAVVPWDGSPTLDWAVAADDRWHRPAEEVTVRQTRPAGVAVYETRLRVPGGDAVHRVWSVADAGGLTVIEVANDSPLAMAVAFTRGDLLTNRPPTDVPIEGIELPLGSIVVPVGHRTAVTVALAHDGRGAGPLPPDVAQADAVARGWRAVVDRASRLDLPEARLVDAVTQARCELLLVGASAVDAPAALLVALGELVRLGQVAPADVVGEVADAVEAVARTDGFAVDAGLAAAAFVLAEAGERRAVVDVADIVRRRRVEAPWPVEPPEGILAVPAVEGRLVRAGRLFPDAIPPAWRGRPVEAHGLVAGPASRLSFALRWHGEHPALLWEVQGEPVALSAPAADTCWRTSERSGEALWHHGPADGSPGDDRGLADGSARDDGGLADGSPRDDGGLADGSPSNLTA